MTEKDMFEYLEVEIYKSMLRNKVKIWIEGDKVHYSLSIFVNNNIQVQDEISTVSVDTLNDLLVATGIGSWERHYDPIDMVFDGENWNIKYKLYGQKVTKIDGENAYPRGWRKLNRVIEQVTGEMIG